MTDSETDAESERADVSGRDAALQRRTLIILAITQVMGTVGVGVAPSIGVLLAGEVTSNEAWAGLARTASTLGAALLGLPLGNLAARFGRRVALTSGWWLAAIGSAILVFAAQYDRVVPLFIGLLLIGAGSATALQSRFAATDLAEPHHKGRALALLVWVGTLGSVLGPNLGVPGETISRHTSLNTYAGAFLITAICLALAGILVCVLLRPDPLLRLLERAGSTAAAPTVKKSGRIRRTFVEVKANHLARYAVVAILTAQIVMVAVMTMTPVHVEHQGGTITIVGIVISLHIVGMYALSPVVGILADKLGHRLTIIIGIVIFVASCLAGAFMAHDTGWIIVCLTLLGLGWSFVNVSASALFSSVISAEARASSQGGIDSLANLLGAIAAFGAGPLMIATNFATLSWIALVLLVPLTYLTIRTRIPAV